MWFCTLRLNRGAPVVLKKLSQKGGIKLDRDTLQYRRRNNTFIICWQDQRLVSMITSLHGPATEKIQSKKRVRTKENVSSVEVTDLNRPKAIGDYNSHMAGVDLFDQKIGYYSILQKTVKW